MPLPVVGALLAGEAISGLLGGGQGGAQAQQASAPPVDASSGEGPTGGQTSGDVVGNVVNSTFGEAESEEQQG